MLTSWRKGLVGLVFALAGVSPAAALTVFACEPEWAALTRVLWPQARVHVATHVGQDPHHIEARPALIAQLRQADLVVCTGGELEAGWLPVLQQRSGNPQAQDVFFAADHVKLIDPQPAAIGSPWAGDVHAHGNPHLHLDPRNLLRVIDALATRLLTLLPGQQAALEQRKQAFEQRWRTLVAQWSEQAAPLRGKPVAVQHATFGYLWHWLGMRPVADLEPKPGMAPTPGHLQRLLETLKPKPPMAVVLAVHQDARAGRWLSGQLTPAAPLLILPATVPESADGAALERWMQGLVGSLLQAAAQ